MRSFGAVLGVALVIGVARPAPARDTWTLDVSRSHATFAIGHIIVETVHGSVPIREGRMETASLEGLPRELESTLDPHGIETGIAERDDTLRGSDYFDVARFPTWTFVMTSIDAGKPLTIHGLLTFARHVAVDHPHRARARTDGKRSAFRRDDRHRSSRLSIGAYECGCTHR